MASGTPNPAGRVQFPRRLHRGFWKPPDSPKRTQDMRKYLCFLTISLIYALIRPATYHIAPIFTAAAQTPPTPQIFNLRAYVADEAFAFHVTTTDALWIVQHESSFDPTRKGDDGQSRGLWQISSIYHPEVSNECAFAASCATPWSLVWIAKGHIDEWSSWKCRYEWYPDATSTLGPRPIGYKTPHVCTGQSL